MDSRTLTLVGARLLLLRQLIKDHRDVKRTVPLAALLAALSLMFGGNRHPLSHTALGIAGWTQPAAVNGFVAPGYERVRRAFERNVREGNERGAQFVVYHRGKKVVDLYGGSLGDAYDGDSLQVIFSCSKVVAAILVAQAVAQGRLIYAERVSTYWPEFAQNGKQDITVADVLRHESGLAYFPERMPMHLAGRDNLDELADFIAKQPPLWVGRSDMPEKARFYHGNTRGFILNELLRRTDPGRRSMGVILREELAQPLGVTVVLGAPTTEERARVTPLVFDPFHHTLGKAVQQMLTGTARPDDSRRSRQFFDKGSDISRWLNAVKRLPHLAEADYFNADDFHDLEIPSANMLSNARSLGRLADLMSRRRLLPPEAHAAMTAEPTTKFDFGMLFKTSFTQGGVCEFGSKAWDPVTQGFKGWGGFGGSQFVWNEEQEVGLAYTMNGPQFNSIMGFRDERCLRLVRATMRSVKGIPDSKL